MWLLLIAHKKTALAYANFHEAQVFGRSLLIILVYL